MQIIKNSTKFLGLANMQQHVKNYLAILWKNNITLFIQYVFEVSWNILTVLDAQFLL